MDETITRDKTLTIEVLSDSSYKATVDDGRQPEFAKNDEQLRMILGPKGIHGEPFQEILTALRKDKRIVHTLPMGMFRM